MTEMLGGISTGDMEKQQGNGEEKIRKDCLEEVMLSCLLEEEQVRWLAKGVPGRGNSKSRWAEV